MKENKFRNNEIAKAVSDIILAQTDFCKMYEISKANINLNIDNSNRVTLISENIELAKELINTMRLQSDFFSATSRITIWLDKNNIVVFVGATFTALSSLVKSDKKADFSKRFNESLDKKYNERTLKGKVITNLTETRHTFDSIESFALFFIELTDLVVARKTALAQTDSTDTAKKDSKKDTAQSQRKTDNKKSKEIKESDVIAK